MSSWYTYGVMALFFMGTQRFLYKVSAERKYNTAWTTFAFMATVSLLSLVLFIVLREPVSNILFLLIIGVINSTAFLSATITHIEALKHVPAGVAYPIIRLNAVIVVLFSVLYFEDRLSPSQVVGIVLAMLVMLILSRQVNDHQRSHKDFKRGLIFVFISLLCGAVASISSKFAATYTNTLAFIALSYTLATLFSFGLTGRMSEREEANGSKRDALRIGIVMGLLNLAGYYSFLKALSIGPLSIIVSITGMHFVVAIILSALIYGEKLTGSRIFGICLTLVSVLLMRV